MDLGIAGLGEATLLGTGGSGAVYRARDLDLSRDVAVKMIHLAHDEPTLRHFESERRMMASLPGHPGVAPVYSSGVTATGAPYFVMPYFATGSLAARVQERGPLDWREACNLVAAVADAVDHVHGYDVLHCDIKPDNIMLDAAGRPVVVDFGIAKLVDGDVAMSRGVQLSPSYAPPEAYAGVRPDRRFDIYSLGATLHSLIGGQPPFLAPDGNILAVATRVATEPPPDLRHRAPAPVCSVIEWAMAKQPDQRPQRAAELAHHLRAAVAASLPSEAHTVMAPSNLLAPSHGSAPSSSSPPGRPWRRPLWLVAAGVVAGLALVATVAVAASLGRRGEVANGPTTTGTSGSAGTGSDGSAQSVSTQGLLGTTDASTGTTSPAGLTLGQLRTGQCVDVPVVAGNFDEAQPRPCDQPHQAEVLGILQHPDAGKAYPGAEVLTTFAQRCDAVFEKYVGADQFATELISFELEPTFDEWQNKQFYDTACMARRADDGLLASSVRGKAADPSVALAPGDQVALARANQSACFTVPAGVATSPSRSGLADQKVVLADCAVAHTGQVVAAGTLTDGADVAFDTVALADKADALCVKQFAVYNPGKKAPASVYGVYADEQEWLEGIRYVSCIIIWSEPTTESY